MPCCKRQPVKLFRQSDVSNEELAMQMNLNKMVRGIGAVVFGVALAGGVMAADNAERDAKRQASADYKATVKKADADYKAAAAHCKSMTGNEKDVCQKEAKAEQKKAKADAQARRDGKKATAEA